VHFEFLLEDQSSEKAMNILIPKLLGDEVTYRTHPYQGSVLSVIIPLGSPYLLDFLSCSICGTVAICSNCKFSYKPRLKVIH